MLTRIRRSLRSRLQTSRWMNREALAEAARDRAGGHAPGAPHEHIDAALDWLVRAQDATPDAGVARAYALAWSPYFGLRGWQPSYPETTGYLIPTFFDAAARLGRPELAERARRMADWEIEVQLESGAVQGGVIGERPQPTPAVFNTGQVILGWVRAHRETGDEAYLAAARRAGDFLLSCQDERGAFARHQSQYARGDATTYNTRAAWGLCQLGDASGEKVYLEAGRRHVAHALSLQLSSGWFRANCLTDPERPLLHTIAYAARGALEVGITLGEERFVEAAARTARGLAARQRPDGGLAGRFTPTWGEAADWSCVTGDAQTAILWSKLAAQTGERELAERARLLLAFLMRTQNRDARDPGLRGGLKGSFPFDGEYGRYELLNWAAKFFVDAMLLEHGPPPPEGARSCDG